MLIIPLYVFISNLHASYAFHFGFQNICRQFFFLLFFSSLLFIALRVNSYTQNVKEFAL